MVDIKYVILVKTSTDVRSAQATVTDLPTHFCTERRLAAAYLDRMLGRSP